MEHNDFPIDLPLSVSSLDQLDELRGRRLGPGRAVRIDAQLIGWFAEATGDRYGVHTDPEFARRKGLPTTIAHGLLTLSLGPALQYELIDFFTIGTVLNYGYDSVRFPAPLPAGSDVSVEIVCTEVERGATSARVRLRHTFTATDVDKPVCVATQVLHIAEE